MGEKNAKADARDAAPQPELEKRYGKIGSAAVKAATMLGGKLKPTNPQNRPTKIVRERQS